MTQTELINYLHAELSNQRTFYTGVIFSLIGIVVFAVGFNFWQQSKLADKKVQELKDDLISETKDELANAQTKITKLQSLLEKYDKENVNYALIQASMASQIFGIRATGKNFNLYNNQLILISQLLNHISHIEKENIGPLSNVMVGLNDGFKILNSEKCSQIKNEKNRTLNLKVIVNIKKFIEKDNIKEVVELKYKDLYNTLVKNMNDTINILENIKF
ncbi:hypothetical protein [uncultured Fructobacillus sp.]|uniref:hypothetical protein n=1 Tax=uncultured Fructobacillus sp. TaxID=591942 RepID=UPI002594E210|nr:hypothetical protein [uncultured Fructobacillus sp.]